jgi:formylglycine-generating enzyme required for sulfatase activity
MKYLIATVLFIYGVTVAAVAQENLLNHEMVFVEGGTFQMGSNSFESDDNPVHTVKLSSFNIGKFEVTQAQWQAIMGTNPSYFSCCINCPVETVSWDDVQNFIKKLNRQTGKNYRLPTEAEWEYAAKGGNKTKGFAYSGSNDLSLVAFNDNRTHTVGGKQPNELGIYDMTGNVCEWCSDWFSRYKSNIETNPKGITIGNDRVVRGCSWFNLESHCQTTFRRGINPNNWYFSCGFRLVLPAVR